MSIVEVKVPDIGDFKEVEVIEVMVKPGDTIKVDQSLLTVESDKASMEIPSSAAGVVKELKVKVGDKVGEGSLVLLLEAADAVAAPAAAAVACCRSCALLLRLPAAPRCCACRCWRHRRSQGPRHRRLQGSGSHRADGQAGRHRQGRPVPDDGRIGQGQHGDSFVGRRRGQGNQGQGGRQGGRGLAGAAAGSGWRRCRAPAAAAPRRCSCACRCSCSCCRRRAGACCCACTRAAAPAAAQADASKALASPSIRKFARELGVDLGRVRRQRSERPHHPAGRAELRQGHHGRDGRTEGGRARRRRPRHRPGRCCHGRRWTSANSARPKSSPCRASRRSPARTCTATG